MATFIILSLVLVVITTNTPEEWREIFDNIKE